MIVLLELLTVLLEYIDLSVIATKDSYYYTNILPIMLALCSMFSGTYYAHNYASIIGGSLLRTMDFKPPQVFKHKEVILNDFKNRKGWGEC